ncbi:MAG: HTTM domain-containing protein [Bacteroidia bacterium]
MLQRFLRILVWLRKGYKLDLRALSLMRIGIGTVVLADLIIRSTAMEAHYTSEGVLPVSLLLEYDFKPLRWSFHYLSDTFAYQSFLFVLHGLITLFLIFGFRTRLFSILSWIFIVSLQNRNPFIQQGGDDLLRLTIFWGMFIPWGAFYSLDRKRSSMLPAKYYFSIANFGYLLLISAVYFFSALYKTSPEWRTEGTAIYYALSLDQIRVGMGDWLYGHPLLMKGLTFFVYYGLEIIAPLIILLPSSRMRAIGALGIIMLHIGIVLNLYVGLFYIIGITSALGLLPSKLMDRLDAIILRSKQELNNSYYKCRNGFKKIKSLNLMKAAFLAFVIILSLLMSLGNCAWFPFKVNYRMQYVTNALKLEQFWGMFSPYIYKKDGWYIYRGLKKDNSVWDIYNDKPGTDTIKPAHIDKMYPTDRWRKFAENYQRDNYNFMRPYYCQYLLKKWNRHHPDNQIDGLNIIFLEEETLPDYKTSPLKQKNVCLCYTGQK